MLAKDLLSQEYLALDVHQTVAEYLGKLGSRKKSFALVFDGKKYLGVIGKSWLLTSRIDASHMKLSNILKHRSKSKTPFFVPKLSLVTSFEEICRLMATSGSKILPVLEKDKVVGVVEVESILEQLKPFYKKVKCSQLSPKEIITVDQNDEIGRAVELMHDNHVDRLPVVDGAKKLVGIFTLRDIIIDFGKWDRTKMHISRAASHQQGKKTGFGLRDHFDLLKVPVSNLIQPNLFVCSPQESVSCAIDMMIKDQVCCVVLVQNNKPVGILTARDILLDFTKA